MRGNPRGKFGAYELYSALDWRTLLFALALSVATWASTYFIPALEAEGGMWAAAAAVLAVILKIVVELLRDNSGKTYGATKK